MNGKIAWTDDDFSEGRERSTRVGRSRFGIARLPIAGVVIAGLVAAAVVGGIVTWLVTGNGDRTTAANNPPLIKADEKPIKVYPENPGGLDVPNRDKLVYSRLKEGSEKGEVERLSPAPEEPLAPPTMLEKPASPVARAAGSRHRRGRRPAIPSRRTRRVRSSRPGSASLRPRRRSPQSNRCRPHPRPSRRSRRRSRPPRSPLPTNP